MASSLKAFISKLSSCSKDKYNELLTRANFDPYSV